MRRSGWAAWVWVLVVCGCVGRIEGEGPRPRDSSATEASADEDSGASVTPGSGATDDAGAPVQPSGDGGSGSDGGGASPDGDPAAPGDGGADLGPDPCAGVTCSGHGTCVALAGAPTCDCDSSFVASGTSCTPLVAGELTLPSAHPRLWFTPARLATARAWFAEHPFSPPASVDSADRALDAALHSLLSQTTTGCDRAVAWAMSLVFSCPGVACDPARWDGEGAIVTFDWCFDRFDASQRQTFTTRWNALIADLNDNDWGGIGMEGNNYYLGYLRNTLEWALASYYENALAPGFLDYALTTRWEDSLRPYLDTFAAGGAPHEGSAYGRRVFAYLTLPFTSLALHGRSLWDETPYFRESVYWNIYSTTPGLTVMPGGAQVYETFPFNEDERWLERDPSAGNTAQTMLGTYLAPLAAHWSTDATAGHIAAFLSLTDHGVDDRFAEATSAAALATVADAPLSALPLDYYASGLGMLYAKTDWSGAATLYHAQLGTPVGVGHEHLDAGSFQLWRGGRWLTRESVGYAQPIAGYRGVGEVDCGSALAHNALLFDGRGMASYRLDRPRTTRLSSDAIASYVVVDLSPAYEVSADWAHREDEVGNPSAGSVVRELLFVRPLETLVVLDRMAGTSAAVTKTFLMHFDGAPTAVDASTYDFTSGSQSLRLSTVVPATSTRRIIDEGGQIGQHRAEIETSGAVESYFLHVLQAADAGAAQLTLSFTETASALELTLSHPTRGQARVVFAKGMTSAGGSFGYAASGVPSLAPLRADVQALQVTADGPQWEE